MKKVLIITYYFPPAGGSAVQRIVKFVKYLPHFGWQPVILTAREGDYVLRDESLGSEIPEDVTVSRTRAPDLYTWYERMSKKQTAAPADLSAIAVSQSEKTTWKGRVALSIRSLLFIPDARCAWLPYAVIKGLRMIREERIDAILSSSPPFTTALIGGLLARLTGLPWISDYRDPWTQAYFYFRRPQPSRCIEDRLERWLLKKATKVVSINERIIDGLRQKYDMHDSEKWGIVPNGYDPEDFIGIEPETDKYFTVTYTGTIHAKMHPAPLMEAVRQLSHEDADFSQSIRLNFVGRVDDDVTYMFKDTAIKNNIRLIPHLPHRECLRYTMGADLLLLLIPMASNSDIVMTGKLFEYLRSGNPILCLSEKGEAAEIIRETGSGSVVPYGDVEKIKDVLRQSFRRWKAGKKILQKPVRGEAIERWDRKKITKKLSDILNNAADR